MILFEVARLKKIVDKYKEKYSRMVGDNKYSKCVILPITKLFEKETIGL